MKVYGVVKVHFVDLHSCGILPNLQRQFLADILGQFIEPILKGQEIQVGFFDTWKLRPIGYPETSVRNYPYSLRDDIEQRSSRLLCGGSLKSRKVVSYSFITLALDGGEKLKFTPLPL